MYTHGRQLKSILDCLQKELDLRLCGVHLVDASHCSDVSKFLSCAMLSLSAMTRMELPWVNVLSKVDTFSSFGAPPLGLDAYTDELDLERVLESAAGPGVCGAPGAQDSGAGESGDHCGHDCGCGSAGDSKAGASIDPDGGVSPDDARAALPRCDAESRESGSTEGQSVPGSLHSSRSSGFFRRWKGLHRALVGVMDSYALVGYLPSTVKDARATARLLRRCDKATGYAFGALHAATEASVAAMVDRVDVDSDATARREAEEAAMEALLGVMQ